ncbi:MAG: hypothetical protein L3J22_04900 [Xanthomonadales bacterium]|nr:hypothetical protein [Xanthomonadales bacterium]
MTIKRYLKLNKFIISSLVLIIFINPVCLASTSPKASLDDLIKKSELIFIGKVVNKKYLKKELMERSNHELSLGEFIYTEYTLEINELLSGIFEKNQMSILVSGGIYDGIGETSSNSYELSDGEELVIFASYNELDEHFYIPNGAQGVFSISTQSPQMELQQKYTGHYISRSSVISSAINNNLILTINDIKLALSQ